MYHTCCNDEEHHLGSFNSVSKKEIRAEYPYGFRAELGDFKVSLARRWDEGQAEFCFHSILWIGRHSEVKA